MSNFKPESIEYKKLRDKAKLLYSLGEVIIEQYGEKESVALLEKYWEEKKKKQNAVEEKDKK